MRLPSMLQLHRARHLRKDLILESLTPGDLDLFYLLGRQPTVEVTRTTKR